MKRRPVLYSAQAEGDFIWIYDTVAIAAGFDIALRYVERIKRFCDGLGYAPERGTRRDEVRPGLRIVGFERRVTVAFVVARTRPGFARLLWRRKLAGGNMNATPPSRQFPH